MTATQSDSAPGRDESFTPPQLRLLKLLVVVMGVILVFGFLALVAAIIWKSNQFASSSTTPATALSPAVLRTLYGAMPGVTYAEAALPDGTRLTASHLAGDRLVLVFEDAGGVGIAQVDIRSGKLIAFTRLNRAR